MLTKTFLNKVRKSKFISTEDGDYCPDCFNLYLGNCITKFINDYASKTYMPITLDEAFKCINNIIDHSVHTHTLIQLRDENFIECSECRKLIS